MVKDLSLKVFFPFKGIWTSLRAGWISPGVEKRVATDVSGSCSVPQLLHWPSLKGYHNTCVPWISVLRPNFSWCSISSFQCLHVWKDFSAQIVHQQIQPPNQASFLLVAASTYWSLLRARVVVVICKVAGFVFPWPGTFSVCRMSVLVTPSMQG